MSKVFKITNKYIKIINKKKKTKNKSIPNTTLHDK